MIRYIHGCIPYIPYNSSTQEFPAFAWEKLITHVPHHGFEKQSNSVFCTTWLYLIQKTELYKFKQGECVISVSSEQTAEYCQSVYENEAIEKPKVLLFAPLIFIVDDDLNDDHEEIFNSVIRHGGMVEEQMDENVSHVICKSCTSPVKNVTYVSPQWIRDCVRLQCLLSPYTRKYEIVK